MSEETLAVAASSSPAQAAPGLSSPVHGGSASLDTSANNSSSKIFDNLEEILIELNNFEKQISKAGSLLDLTIPSTLESYLKLVANAGSAQFPWTKVKPLFRVKLEQVINEFNSTSPTAEIPPMPNVDPFNFDTVKEKVFDQLEAFVGIPFTVQRLAELLTSPKRHYRRTDKFMRALEKNMLVVSTVEARAVAAAAAAAAGNDSVTHNSMVNGSDHNVLPMATSHNMRRSQSPTSSGFIKASKLLENREKEAEAKVNGDDDDSMDDDEKSSTDDDKLSTESDSSEQSSSDSSEKSASALSNEATKNPDSSEMDDASDGCEANPRVSEDSDNKDKMDVEVNESNNVPSTSEDDGPATPEKIETAAATAATSTSSPSSDPNTASVATVSPVIVGDSASSSSDISQESVEDSSHQNESSEEKSIETPVGTTTEEDGNGCEAQNIKPDEGEPVADDGGPCDSADSNATLAVSSAPALETSAPAATSSPTPTAAAEVGSSEPQDTSTCAATSSETKDQTDLTATVEALPAADVSSDADPHATSSKIEDSDNSMEVDAECTSSENQIHTSST